MLGVRVKQARTTAGLSLRDLAEKVGVSAMALSKYERDEINPSSEVLMSLARALNVRVEYFFRRAQVELVEVDFRKHAKLSKRDEDQVLADVREQVERWQTLEEIIPSSWPEQFKIPDGLPAEVATMDAIEGVAEAVRSAWKLGTNPIRDLMEELELEGIKVIVTPHDGDKKFDGLVALANGKPVIVVGQGWPGDRQRFTLAHELGHLVLRGRLAADLDEERACHRFAGAFLAPRQEAIRALGESRSRLEPQELHLLKHEWGLSMGGWIHRAQDLGVINRTTAGKLWGYFSSRGWREKEPGTPYPNERVQRFHQLVYRALAEDFIGESKAAELLGIGVANLRALRRMEASDEADCH